MMKITILTSGDPSVGISGDEVVIDYAGLEDFIDDDDTTREHLRKDLQEFWAEWLDGRPWVIFEDECGDCGARIVDGKCSRAGCINNSYADA